MEESDDDIMEMSTGKKGFIRKDTCLIHKSSNHSNKECFVQHPHLKVGEAKKNGPPRKERPGTSTKKAKPFAGNSKARKRFLPAILAKMDEDLSSSESESDSEQSDESDTNVLCEEEMKEDTVSMMVSHILMMGDECKEDPFLSGFPHAAQEPKPEVVVTPPGDPGIDLDLVKDEPYLERSDWVAELEAELGLLPKTNLLLKNLVAKCLGYSKLPEER